MSIQEARVQYQQSLKAGQRYYKNALRHGEYPYPLVLDEILGANVSNYQEDLGLVSIPTELIVGTKSAGRVAALSGSFMPLLSENTEFAAKWISLCAAHLSDEGLRDPIRCYEYMGYFYVQEGNKRVSVLKSYGAPTVSGCVIRILPAWSEEEDVRAYYEFLDFYRLSGMYGVSIRRSRGYARLQALLGYEPDHVWTEAERRSFSAGYSRFRSAYDKLNGGRLPLTAAEALLVWLEVFPFADAKNDSAAELTKSLASLWPDLEARAESRPAPVSVEPGEGEKSLLSRVLGVGGRDRVTAAFIYAFDPAVSVWTRSHELGRLHLEQALGERVRTRVYTVRDRDYLAAVSAAAEDGADVIFATTPSMMDACRRVAATHSAVRILNCSLSRPLAGVRTYYSRTYECKFITGAIAGAMSRGDAVGYIANYPILGVGADINAFALGVRLTNPRARVKLAWSCVAGDPLQTLLKAGVNVISNRDAAAPGHAHYAMDWGTYLLEDSGSFVPLAVPCWNWGGFYEKLIRGILSGVWSGGTAEKSVKYWWGLAGGVLDVQLSEALPEGVRALAEMLRGGIVSGAVDPFRRRITDQSGTVRSEGGRSFSPDELMTMDWLCDAVDGAIPAFDELLPRSRELVAALGLRPAELPPASEGALE